MDRPPIEEGKGIVPDERLEANKLFSPVCPIAKALDGGQHLARFPNHFGALFQLKASLVFRTAIQPQEITLQRLNNLELLRVRALGEEPTMRRVSSRIMFVNASPYVAMPGNLVAWSND